MFFSAQYLPTAGGVERYTYNLARVLTQWGHECTVVTSALPGLPAEETAEGIHVVRLPSLQLMNGRFPILKPSKQARAFAKIMKGGGYRLAVINTRFYPLSMWAAGVCKRAGVPAIVIEHGVKHIDMGGPLLNAAGHVYEHGGMWLVRRSQKDFYTVARRGGEWLRHFHLQAKGVLYNSVDVAAVQAAADRGGDARALWEIPPTAPLVVFTGRLIEEKGVWELLDAFALVREKFPGARLLLAGEGPEMAALAAKLPEGARLLGALPFERNMALLAASDVFCLPTYSEGFATTVLEAAALGCCIVTTETGGSDEMIAHGEDGWLVGLAPAEIAGRICQSLADPVWRKAAGEALREKAKQRFSWESTAAALVEVAKAKNSLYGGGRMQSYLQMALRLGPLAAGFALLLYVPLRLLFLRRRGLAGQVKREILLAALCVYTVAALVLVWMPGGTGYTRPFFLAAQRLHTGEAINLVPLYTLRSVAAGGSRVGLLNLVSNVLLFFPFGLLLPAVFVSCRRWYKTIPTALLVSVLVETAQLFIGRSVDIDDVLLNTLGAALGYGVWRLRAKWRRKPLGKGLFVAGGVVAGGLVGIWLYAMWVWLIMSPPIATYPLAWVDIDEGTELWVCESPATANGASAIWYSADVDSLRENQWQVSVVEGGELFTKPSAWLAVKSGEEAERYWYIPKNTPQLGTLEMERVSLLFFGLAYSGNTIMEEGPLHMVVQTGTGSRYFYVHNGDIKRPDTTHSIPVNGEDEVLVEYMAATLAQITVLTETGEAAVYKYDAATGQVHLV